MKFKKIMLVTFLLLAVLTIGAVSASDDATSDDLAVFDDGDSIDSPVDDVDLLSDPEDYDGGDDDDYDEYEVSVAEEFDVNDENATVVSLTCPDEAEGQFVVDVYIEGSEYYNPFHTVYHNIVPADYDKQISWTVKDLTITQSGSYSFAIYHLEEDDEKGDDTLIGDGEGDAVDYNAFRIVGDDDEKNCLDNSPVFALYCPDGHEGIVNVTVRNAQYEEQTFSKDIKDKDEYNFLYWTLEELNMTEIGEYQIAVSVNDGEFDKNWEVEVCSPVSITEDVSYIGSLIKRLDEFVVFMIPSDAEGNIVIEIDDVEIFNKNLDEFKQVDNEDYYWHYPAYGPDDVDTSFKYYAICSEAIPDVEEGDYEITARFTLGTTTYQESKTVTFKKSNIKTKDGVSIELLQEDKYEIRSNEYIALIAVPEEADGDIVVTSDGETLCNCAIYDLDDDDGIFVLSVYDLSINEDGSWALNVAYFEDGEKIVENEGNFFFVYDEDDDDDDAEDGVIIRVVDGDEDEFNLDDPEDLEKYFAHVSVSNDLKGNITIIVYGDDEEDSIVIFNKDISVIEDKNDDDDYEDFTCYNINFYDLDDFEVFKTHGSFEIRFMEFDEDDSGEYVELDSAVFIIDYDDGIVKFWSEDDDEDEDDEEDGVVIWVADGDEFIFDLDEDLDEIFCIVSVENGLNGSIVINGLVYDEFEDEDIEIPLFDKDLSEIEDNEPDEELEGFTRYKIRLSDLSDLDGLKSQERIWVAFFETGEEDELDSREYSVEYYDDTNEIEFWEIDDDDEDEGEPINAEFCDANVLTDDVVVYISKDDFPEDADDEFEVFIGEEEYPIRLKLSELDGDDEFYFIRVSDLFPEFEEMFESYGVGIFVQFYVDGDKAYYAAPEDDEEGVCIYYSPYIEGEAYLLNDDFVISFRGFEEVDDEFNVTISRPGIDDIVKTFKISELDNLDDEDGEFYELHLSDLGITETDEYDILVEFTKNGELLVYNNRTLAVGMVNIRSHEYDDEGERLATFDSIDMLVFNIKVNENVTGFARLYVNNNLVGDRISFADLRYGTHPPDDGRQIVLNDLNIRESGQYQVRLEVYDENDELLADKDIQLLVEVDENSVSFEDGVYGCEAFDVIRFSIGTPLSAGQCYNIYFNGKKAGNFTANGIVIFDEYLDEIFDVKLMKGGDYDVNVKFFDGENEIPFDTGSFSILKLALFSDKDVYLFGIDDTLVSFKLDYPVEGARLDAYYLYNWGPQGMDGDMLFNPFIDDGILELVKDGVLTFEAAWSMAGSYNFEVGTNYIYVTYRYDNDGDDYLYQFGGIIAIEVVEPVDPELTITVTNVSQGTDAVITITTNETFTGNVTVYIGNGVYEVAVVNGKGTRNLSTVLDVVPGTYDAEAKFKATGLFESSSKTAKFTVTSKPSEMDPNLTISVADITEGASAVVKITTQTTFSGTVTVQIANRNYTVPVSNGAGSISVPGLAVGSYTATAFFAATDKFDASIKATTFKVNKKPDVIKLALKKVKVKKSAKKAILKATLKINGKAVKGLVVTFKFNKKTLKAKTNKKGVAKAKVNRKVLKKLKVGKKVKVKAIYGNAVAKKTAKVKK